jgi:hypothetical protein
MRKQVMGYTIVALASAVLTTILQPLAHLPVLAGANTQLAAQSGNCAEFKETGKRVCGRFLQYWQQNGGLPQQGYPISNEFVEKSDLDGKSYTVQYFERSVFELHPENRPPYDVLLSQLGTLRFREKHSGVEPGVATPTPQPQVKIYGLGDRIELAPGVNITFSSADFVHHALEAPGMDWNAKVTNGSDQSFFYSVPDGSVLLKDSTGKASDPGRSNPAEVRIPPKGTQDVTFYVRNYTPSAPVLDYVQLTIESISAIGDSGPIIVRYKP